MTLGGSGPTGAGATVSPIEGSSVAMRQTQTSPLALPQRRFASSPLAGPSTGRFADTPRTATNSPQSIYTPSDGRFASFTHASPPLPFTTPSSPNSTRLRAGRTPPTLPTRSPVSQSGSPLTRRRLSEHSLSGGGLSQTPYVGSLVGSYEESLLTGRMSTLPSKPLVFDAELGVLGLGKCKSSLKCPPHLSFRFPAYFYSLDGGAAAAEKEGKATPSTPYVGTIDLEGHYLDQLLQQSDADALSRADGTSAAPIADMWSSPANAYSSHPMRAAASTSTNRRNMSKKSPSAVPSFPGYRVPPKGQVQLVIKNPNLTAVKVFLVPYDLTDMPAGTKTFIRQKCHVAPPSNAAADVEGQQSAQPPASPRNSLKPAARETLRYAVHLQFCAIPATPSQRRASEPGFGGDGRLRMSATEERLHDGQKGKAGGGEPRIYLHKAIRVVFSARVPDKSERLSSVTETPRSAQGEGMYSTYVGPGEEWKDARRAAKAEEAAAVAAAHAIRTRVEAEQAHLDVDFDHSMANSDPNGERWDQRTPDGVQRSLSPSINDDMVATAGVTDDVGEARDSIAALQLDAVDIPSHSRTTSWNRSRATSEAPPSRFATHHVHSIAAASMQEATRARAPSLETLSGAAPSVGRYAAAPLVLSDEAADDDRALLEQWHASLGGARTARPPSPTASRSRPTSPPLLRSPNGGGGGGGSALAMTRTLSNTSAASLSDHQPMATSSSRSSLRGAASRRALTPQRTESPSPFASLYATPAIGANGGGANAGLQSLPSPKLSAASIDAEHVNGVIMPFALGNTTDEGQQHVHEVSSDSAGLRPSLLRRLSSQTNGGSQSSGRGSPAVSHNNSIAANIFAWRQAATRSRTGSEESIGGGEGRSD